MHERRRIRELVVRILTDDAQGLFSRPTVVQDSPALPIHTKMGQDNGLLIRVYLNGDQRVGDERAKQDPCEYLREGLLEIHCITEASDIWDHAVAVDGFCEEVEAVMAKYLANYLDNTVQAFEYADTEVQFTKEDNEVTYAIAAVRYDVQFRTQAWEVHPDLTGTDVEYELKDSDGDTHLAPPHAVDTADVP